MTYESIWEVLSVAYYIFANFKIACAIRCIILPYYHKHEKDRIFLYHTDSKSHLKSVVIWLFLALTFFVIKCYTLRINIIDELILFGVFLIPIVVIHLFLNFDKNNILETNGLNIGYGAAMNYYKNYLEMLFENNNFQKRIEYFQTYEGVEVKKKHFILVPESCRIKCYLDDSRTIERCKELQKQEITQGGIKNRVYNITVYLIKTDENGAGLRMSVEYAQPLKALLTFKQKGIITEEEMKNQRQLFVKELQKFMRDSSDSYKLCEVVEYNDAKNNVSKILLESCHISLPHETV